jgi:hypothetical protein
MKEVEWNKEEMMTQAWMERNQRSIGEVRKEGQNGRRKVGGCAWSKARRDLAHADRGVQSRVLRRRSRTGKVIKGKEMNELGIGANERKERGKKSSE